MSILLLIGGLVLSIATCIVFALILQNQGGTSRADATATAFVALQTRLAASTPTKAPAKATATTVAKSTPTSPPRATATSEAPSQQQALQRALQWSVVLRDSFNDNTNSWSTKEYTNEWITAARNVTQGKYRWEMTAHKGVFSSITADPDAVNDFYLSVDAQKLSGPSDTSMALMFRKDGDDKYVFLIRDDRYKLSIQQGGEWSTLISWTNTSVLRSGRANTLAVVGEGSHFTLYINDTFVDEIDNSQLSSGKVGLGVELNDTDDKGIYEFDNFELRVP